MSEKPILFLGEMVRAILDGKKTMTRRVIKPQPSRFIASYYNGNQIKCHELDDHESGIKYGYGFEDDETSWKCPYGKPRDTLWVKETWADTNGECGPMVSYKSGGDKFLMNDPDLLSQDGSLDYDKLGKCQFAMWCGDLRRGEPGHSWRPSIHMPRWASRINLLVKSVTVQRLQDISNEDCAKEGIGPEFNPFCDDQNCNCNCGNDVVCKEYFQNLWDSINAKKPGGSWADNPWVWAIEFEVQR